MIVKVMTVMMMLMTMMMMEIDSDGDGNDDDADDDDSDGDVAAQLTVARHQRRFKIPERTPLLVTRLCPPDKSDISNPFFLKKLSSHITYCNNEPNC